MKKRTSKFSEFCVLSSVALVIVMFVMALFLVKSRQNILLSGRKISQIEKNLSAYSAKNAELDAKILRLCSSKSLRSLIKAESLVVAGNKNVVKIPKTETSFYAMNRASGANKFASETFHKQTNLTINN